MDGEGRRRAILRRCLREAGYGVRPETGTVNICKKGEIEVVLTKRDWGGITACAPLEQLKNPRSYYVTVRYEEVGREWGPTIPKHNIDLRESSKEVRDIIKTAHPEWFHPKVASERGGNPKDELTLTLTRSDIFEVKRRINELEEQDKSRMRAGYYFEEALAEHQERKFREKKE